MILKSERRWEGGGKERREGGGQLDVGGMQGIQVQVLDCTPCVIWVQEVQQGCGTLSVPMRA